MLLSRLDAIQARIVKLKRSQGAAELPRLGRCRLKVSLDNVGGQSAAAGLKRQIEVRQYSQLVSKCSPPSDKQPNPEPYP